MDLKKLSSFAFILMKHTFFTKYKMPLFHYQLKEYNNINLKELTRFAPA
jgi:hypothetical protein